MILPPSTADVDILSRMVEYFKRELFYLNKKAAATAAAFILLSHGKADFAGAHAVKVDFHGIVAGGSGKCGNIQLTVMLIPHITPGLLGGIDAVEHALLITDHIGGYDIGSNRIIYWL